jgi:anthranilate synthase component 2
MIVVIDNYDSFTFNLVQLLQRCCADSIEVIRNDACTVQDIAARIPRAIVISPGPGRPEHAGVSLEVMRSLGGTTPILGICLGMQCLAVSSGADIRRAKTLVHGKTSAIHHIGTGLFEGIPQRFSATRYHSLAVDPLTLPPSLKICAWTDDDEVMGVTDLEAPRFGVQFHPESFMSEAGTVLIENFLRVQPTAPSAC